MIGNKLTTSIVKKEAIMQTIDEKIEATKVELEQSENHLNLLLNRKRGAERKERTHRLIERGAVLESVLKGSEKLTTEQLQILLSEVFHLSEVTAYLQSHNTDKLHP